MSPQKIRKVKNRPEQDLQIQCVTWFRYQYPSEILIHIPNGGKRSKVEAARFKEMGVLAGFPDLALFRKSNQYGALFIELKASAKHETSYSQASMINSLNTLGYKAVVVSNFETFRRVVNDYLRKQF